MTEAELNEIQRTGKVVTLITAESLSNREDRTLLYGYTCDRDTWHVYLHNNVIHTCMYWRGRSMRAMLVESNEAYVPNKRLYPERCDFEFCTLLRRAGVYLPFTTYDADNVDKLRSNGYFGETISDQHINTRNRNG